METNLSKPYLYDSCSGTGNIQEFKRSSLKAVLRVRRRDFHGPVCDFDPFGNDSRIRICGCASRACYWVHFAGSLLILLSHPKLVQAHTWQYSCIQVRIVGSELGNCAYLWWTHPTFRVLYHHDLKFTAYICSLETMLTIECYRLQTSFTDFYPNSQLTAPSYYNCYNKKSIYVW